MKKKNKEARKMTTRVVVFNISRKKCKTSKVNQQSVLNL